jgi:hypothetical protein
MHISISLSPSWLFRRLRSLCSKSTVRHLRELIVRSTARLLQVKAGTRMLLMSNPVWYRGYRMQQTLERVTFPRSFLKLAGMSDRRSLPRLKIADRNMTGTGSMLVRELCVLSWTRSERWLEELLPAPGAPSKEPGGLRIISPLCGHFEPLTLGQWADCAADSEGVTDRWGGTDDAR